VKEAKGVFENNMKNTGKANIILLMADAKRVCGKRISYNKNFNNGDRITNQ